MRIAELADTFLVILPFLFLGEAVVAAIVWLAFGGKGGRWAKVTAWVGLTTLTLWCGSAIAFVVLHGLLFIVGPPAAIAGVIATTVFMLTMPFGWALIIRRRTREEGRSQS